MISGHGDDRHQFNTAIRADFSSNTWFEGPDLKLLDHLQKNIQLIARYPEPDAAGFCQKISEHHEVNPDQVLAFNGSVEAFYTIALAFRGTHSAILSPAFAEYEDACRMHDHQLTFFSKNEWAKSLNSNPALFWLGNPNNPDGQIFEFQEIKSALENYPNTVFVVDEAYAGLVYGFESVIPLTKIYQNLIVVRSLTKCCAIPGLRLGYVVASASVTSRLRKFQQPWSVNALAQETGKFILGNQQLIFPDTKRIGQLSNDLQKAIGQFRNFRVFPSEASFFLIEMLSGTAATLKQFLLDRHGLLIRDASNFRGLNERFFRVSTRDEKDNRLLVDGLTNWERNH
jgi:threonine-phosphate decarboxylase